MQSGSQISAQSAPATWTGAIPTSHETLDAKEVESFGEWLDPQLAELEETFREFWTPSSFKKSLSR